LVDDRARHCMRNVIGGETEVSVGGGGVKRGLGGGDRGVSGRAVAAE
jgi:hypothetical protein